MNQIERYLGGKQSELGEELDDSFKKEEAELRTKNKLVGGLSNQEIWFWSVCRTSKWVTYRELEIKGGF